jgi:hypothetical protein
MARTKMMDMDIAMKNFSPVEDSDKESKRMEQKKEKYEGKMTENIEGTNRRRLTKRGRLSLRRISHEVANSNKSRTFDVEMDLIDGEITNDKTNNQFDEEERNIGESGYVASEDEDVMVSYEDIHPLENSNLPDNAEVLIDNKKNIKITRKLLKEKRKPQWKQLPAHIVNR